MKMDTKASPFFVKGHHGTSYWWAGSFYLHASRSKSDCKAILTLYTFTMCADQLSPLPLVPDTRRDAASKMKSRGGSAGTTRAKSAEMKTAMQTKAEDSPLPPIFIGSRSLNLQSESKATAVLTGKLLLKRKTKHDLNNLLMETWLNDVLSAGAENDKDSEYLVVRFASLWPFLNHVFMRQRLISD